MKGNTDFQEYVPIMHILHSVTKMDVRLIDQSGDIFNEIIIHEIPAVLEQPKEDFKHILGVLRQHEPERFYQHISPYGLDISRQASGKPPPSPVRSCSVRCCPARK